MTGPRVNRNAVRYTRPSQTDSQQDSQHELRNSQNHQHAWHTQNSLVPHQYPQHNSGVYQQFYSIEGLARFDDYGRPYFVRSHAPELFHSTHHAQNGQNPQTFAPQEYNQSPTPQYTHNHHQHNNSFVHRGVTVSHSPQQSTHDPRNHIQQFPPHGLLNDPDSLQELSRELSQLPLTARQRATTSTLADEGMLQKHSREHVKVMIELGNRKRIKHPGDTISGHDFSQKNELSLDIISQHHPVNVKPVELQIKTLPISEMLRRNATLGGYIFLCKDETMNLEIIYQLFVLPARYKDSVRAITPGIPLFLYNVTRHELHGIFEAASFGTYDTNPLLFLAQSDSDKFPARVACRIRKRYHALAEEEFRYALSHYDGPKFILQLSVPQAIDIITLFEEQQIPPQDRRHGPFSYCHRDPKVEPGSMTN